MKLPGDAATRLPTVQLTRTESGSLSHLEILRLVQAGFTLSDVQAMVESSRLFKTYKLLERIMGKSARTIQRLSPPNAIRLNTQQSALAFQYAMVLEFSVFVFGSQAIAEHWLNRSCRQLSGFIPFEMVDTSLGFSIVMDYLERVRLGVYQ